MSPREVREAGAEVHAEEQDAEYLFSHGLVFGAAVATACMVGAALVFLAAALVS